MKATVESHTLKLTTIPEAGLYKLGRPYFRDQHGNLWCNDRPLKAGERLRLYKCDQISPECGEPSSAISDWWEKVEIDGVETPVYRYDRRNCIFVDEHGKWVY